MSIPSTLGQNDHEMGPKSWSYLWPWRGGSEVKVSACNAGDLGMIPGLGRSPGEGNGNPLQYSCLENPMDRGAWWATVHGVQRVEHDWVTSLSLSLSGVSQLETGACHLPLQRLNHGHCSCWPSTYPKRSSGWRSEWRTLCSGKNWQNRPLDS